MQINNMTVSEAIDRYIKSKYTVLSPSTVNGYIIIRRNQLQNLMSVNLTDITSELYQSAINRDMLKYSSKSISNAVGLVTFTIRFHCRVNFQSFSTRRRFGSVLDRVDYIILGILRINPACTGNT